MIIVTERGMAFTAEQFAEQWADVLDARARNLLVGAPVAHWCEASDHQVDSHELVVDAGGASVCLACVRRDAAEPPYEPWEPSDTRTHDDRARGELP